jgi:hypothetical protein
MSDNTTTRNRARDNTPITPDNLYVLVCSGNMGNAQPDAYSIAAWIPLDGRCLDALESPYDIHSEPSFTQLSQFDIIAIGMQESTFDPPASTKEGGLIRIKIPVVSKLSNYATSKDHTKQNMFRKQKGEQQRRVEDLATTATSIPSNEWKNGTTALHRLFHARLPSYQHAVSFQRGEMRLEIFYLTSQVVSCEILNVAAQNTGMAGLANKGGIVAELLINNNVRISFCTCHLEAHEGRAKYNTRCSTIATIFQGTRTGLHDVSMSSHYSFFLGDLNFRTELSPNEYKTEDDHKQLVRDMVDFKDWPGLNEADELKRALGMKHCLVGYKTLDCNFPPTFKVQRKVGFEYIEKRRASYCDRILWKAGPELEEKISPIIIEPIDLFSTSDHKPIRAAFSIHPNPVLKMRSRVMRNNGAINKLSYKKANEQDAAAANKESFHIFVSSVNVRLDMDAYYHQNASSEAKGAAAAAANARPPRIYVMLVTHPTNIFVQHIRRFLRRLQEKFFCHDAQRITNGDGSITLSAGGWPRSSSRRLNKASNQVDWEEEEIHARIKTHHHDGSAIDLTGAMMNLTVMDADVRNQDSNPVIGSVSFNLSNLLGRCKPPDGTASTEEWARWSSGSELRPNVSNDSSRRFASRVNPALRGSVMNVFKGSVATHIDDDSPIIAAKLDEPLLKNGLEVGRLQCTVEAWWISQDATNASFASDFVNVELYQGSPAQKKAGVPALDYYLRGDETADFASSSKSYPVRREGTPINRRNAAIKYNPMGERLEI